MNINKTNTGYQNIRTMEYRQDEDGCQPFDVQKEIRQLQEQLERLERTVATLRRKVYNSPYETREAL